MNKTAQPALRESGITWVGKIPSHWDVRRVKWTVSDCTNGIWGNEPDGVDDVVCVRVADFDRDGLKVKLAAPTIRAVEPSLRESRQLRRGDLLLEKSGGGDKQLVGCVVQFDHDVEAVCSNFVARMQIDPEHYARYWCYVHASLYSGRLNYPSIKQTTGIQNLDAGAYLNTLVAYPLFSEQERIASFLDSKTSQIDALIAKKRALIEKLKEKRLAGIARAVTKGLDPKAPLRDSGVPWIGLIPDSWDSANLRRFAVMRTGHTPSRSEPSYWQDCNIPWFGLVDVWQLRDGTRTYLGETKEQISAFGLASSAAELLPAGTVVFSRTASVGFSGIMPVPMATTQDFWNWVPEDRLLPEYLLFLFRAMSQEFERLTMGSTHKTIYQPDAASLRVCVPSLPEQQAIVAHIIKTTKVIDEMVTKVELAITRLIEYRSALITAAVTGKLNVHQLAIPATA
jgi:type I restriction enzyme, S subunit